MPVAKGSPNSSRFSVCRVKVAAPSIAGRSSARRWPTRASAVRTLSRAMAALTPWVRPRVIAWSRVMGPCGTAGCWAEAPAAGAARSQSTSSGGAIGERRMGRASVPGHGARQHPVEVQVDEPFDRLLVGERLRIEVVEKALHLGGVDQQGGQPSRCEAVRARPELAGSRAALQDLLDEAPGAQDDLVKVEAREFGEVP